MLASLDLFTILDCHVAALLAMTGWNVGAVPAPPTLDKMLYLYVEDILLNIGQMRLPCLNDKRL